MWFLAKAVGRFFTVAACLLVLSVWALFDDTDALDDVVIDKSLLTWILYGDVL